MSDYIHGDMTIQEYRDYLDRYSAKWGDAPVTAADFLEAMEGPTDLKPEAPGPFDEKPPMHSLPLEKLATLARVLDYGNRKYAKDNWIGTAVNPDLYIGAALRHLAVIRAGIMYDESGLPHVGHLQASVLILEEALRNSGQLK